MSSKRILNRIGFFRELPHGDDDGPALAGSVRDAPGVDEQRLVEYLRAGVSYIVSPGVVRDALDQSGPVGTGSVLTDGTWAWPDDLPHYVERYHIALPEDFVAHARAAGWSIEDLSIQELRRLSLT